MNSTKSPQELSSSQLEHLAHTVKRLARTHGFQACGITGINLEEAGSRLKQWLQQGYHGDMAYMQRHGSKRFRPAKLVPGTVRVISLRMDYLAPEIRTISTLSQPEQAYISRYALGRDYHKIVRKRLAKVARELVQLVDTLGYRVFVDSAPVLEKPLAQQAGLGWQGKHTLLLNRNAGSWFVLGEIFIDLPLPIDEPYNKDHCSRCTACMDVCPTQAFPKPYVLDARRCISYLTIEYKGSIPKALRRPIGNRVFGCDDCQLVCPWNRYAKYTAEDDFKPRHKLNQSTLVDLFNWTEAQFLSRTEGSPIRRTGYHGWLRNLAIGLGNGPPDKLAIAALQHQAEHSNSVVREQVQWSLQELQQRQAGVNPIVPHRLLQFSHKLKHLDQSKDQSVGG
jgi:epoxyqueuosine reductase